MHFRAPLRLLRAAGAVLLLIASGCSTATDPVWPAMLSVVLTDGSPAATASGESRIVSARVTIARVYLEGELGRQLLLDREETVDLLALDAHAATLVERAKIPAGRYDGLRLVMTGAYLEIADDAGSSRIYASSPAYAALPEGSTLSGQLLLPGHDSGGLAVEIADGLHFTAGDQSLQLTFDVSGSFGAQAGLAGRWVMTPSITGRTVR